MKRIGRILVAVLAVAALTGPYTLAHAKEGIGGAPPRMGGKVKYYVNKSNVEEFKGKLPEGLYRMIKEWNRTIPVYDAIHDYVFPKEYLEATEKYKGTARINKKGGLENYTAGLPFPDPKTGAEAMYDFEYKYNGDDFKYFLYDMYSISQTGKINKVSGSYIRLNYQGRLYLDPKPTIPSPEGVELKDISALTYPEDVAGLALLTVRYQDPDKSDDGWMYIPTIRRVRRISVVQRGDTFGGTDLTWDDYRGFSGKVSDYSWKLIGKKEMLVVYHQNVLVPRIKDKMVQLEDDRFELRPVVIVEGVNKLKNYVFSRRRIYLDPDSWAIVGYELYDRQGKLWKYAEYAMSFEPRNHFAFGDRYYLVDLIAKRATLATQVLEKLEKKEPIQELNLGFTEDMFTPTRLQTWTR
jgi:hypothetical protein